MIKERIGFVGAGLMGHGVAKFLIDAGYDLAIMGHRNRAPIDDLVARGANEVGSVRELAALSDLVFLCLPDATIVEAVICGKGGLLEGAHPGLLVLDMTTSLPSLTQRLGQELAAFESHILDAPLTRTPKEAEEGRANILLGGEQHHVDRIRPIVACFTENVWHVGPLGAAHAFKLLNNSLVIANIATVLEAAVAAERFGIDHALVLEICNQGGAGSAAMKMVLPYAVSGDASGFQAQTSTALKDLRYYHQLADDAGLTSLMSKSAQQLFQLATNLGCTDALVPELYDALSALDGTGNSGRPK